MLCVLQSMEPDREVYYMKKKDMKNDDMEFRDDRGTSFVYDGSGKSCEQAGHAGSTVCTPDAAEENAGYSEASDCSCHPCSSTETELSCRSGTGGRHDSHATGRSSSVHDVRSDEHAEVALVKCESYDRAEVYQAVSAAVELLGGMENLIGLPKDSHIVLKPNLLTKADPEKACTTHPAVFEAAGRLLQEAGFSDLCYGDSPGPSRLAPEKIAEECGLSGPADRLGIPFGDFEHGTEVRFPEGRAETRFVLCNEIARADGVVDICKMKTHQLERITGAVKNTFGCVYGFNKGASHARFATAETFARMIADLNDLVRPVLHIMDGVTAMEGNGPGSGTPTQMDVILVSKDPVALDTVFSHLVYLDPKLVPTNVSGMEKGVGTMQNITVVTPSGRMTPAEAAAEYGRSSFNVQRGRDYKGIVGAARFLAPILEKKPVVIADRCIGCGMCVSACPVDHKAVKLVNHKAVYDYSRCIKCYCCQEMCPEKAITVKRSLLAKILDRKWRI